MRKKNETWSSFERLAAYSTTERNGFRFRAIPAGILPLPNRWMTGIAAVDVDVQNDLGLGRQTGALR